MGSTTEVEQQVLCKSLYGHGPDKQHFNLRLF